MNEEKKRLRKRMKEIRSRLEDREEREERLLKNFLQSGFGSYDSFFIYRSFATEAPTGKLEKYLLSAGKKVYFPVTRGEEMYLVEDSGKFVIGAYGIKEPVGERTDETAQVTVLPLLAVDKTGARLGYGGGYYDRYLQDHETLKIAYCYDEQVVSFVPTEETDVKMQAIVTDQRVIVIEEE